MHSIQRRWLAALAGVALVIALASAAFAAPAAQSATTVQVATNATLGQILVNGQGFTLYTLSSETGGNIQCMGSCLQAWPPLLLPAGTAAPTAPAGLPGSLGVTTRSDGGHQVTYNGFPLYTFSGDAKAGDVNGEGIQLPPGTWHAAKVSASGPVATPTGTTTSAPPLAAVFPPKSSNNAKLGTILTDANGRTLYYLTSEAGAHLACTGGCLSFWPPLLLPASTPAPSVSGFPGTFGSVTRADGSIQVTYDSFPVYIFAKDSSPGDTNGEGIKAFGGVWHAVTPQVAPLAAVLGARLTVHVTTTGGTVWGKVVVRYASGGRTVSQTCAAATCHLAVPVGAIVHFSQKPLNAATWPFHGWRIKNAGRTRTLSKSAPSIKIGGNSTVTAIYVLA
jgi:predicted lipoprotein with Yx(FWY)xxD motif